MTKITTTKLDILKSDAVGLPLLRLAGRLTFGESSRALRQAVTEVAGEGSRYLLLDLQEVSYIDSSGLGVLASGHNALKGNGGGIALLNVPKPVQDLLEMCRLTTVFRVFSSPEEAATELTECGTG